MLFCYSLLVYKSTLYDYIVIIIIIYYYYYYYYMGLILCPNFVVHIGPTDLNISRVLPIRYCALEIS